MWISSNRDVRPIVQKLTKFPYHLEKLVQEENKLIELRALEIVSENKPTFWCTNLVPKANNPDKIRYCSNMRVPNEAIKRPTTEALTVEDV